MCCHFASSVTPLMGDILTAKFLMFTNWNDNEVTDVNSVSDLSAHIGSYKGSK